MTETPLTVAEWAEHDRPDMQMKQSKRHDAAVDALHAAQQTVRDMEHKLACARMALDKARDDLDWATLPDWVDLHPEDQKMIRAYIIIKEAEGSTSWVTTLYGRYGTCNFHISTTEPKIRHDLDVIHKMAIEYFAKMDAKHEKRKAAAKKAAATRAAKKAAADPQ